MTSSYMAIAADPQIIPGVHHHCDEWCDYCGVQARCFAFRCTEAFRRAHGRADAEETFATLSEAVQFTREVASAEGRRTDELDALLSHPPGESDVRTSDPITGLAWTYALASAVLLGPASASKRAGPLGRKQGPTAEEVIAWYQLRIYGRVFRACVARDRRGSPSYEDEAVGSAKVALLGVQRSRAAWRSLRGVADGQRAGEVVALLDAIEHGLDERFPDARRFVRIGLDVAVM